MSKLYQDENRLESSEVRKILIEKGYDKDHVDKILEQFWFRDLYISLVTYKPFFELLKKYLKENKPEKFHRSDFYQFIFSELIGKPDSIKYKQIQKLALAFEQMHTDKLELSKYRELLNKLKILQGFFVVEFLKGNPLVDIREIKEENNQTFFVWGHHTLTEYLAADFILKQKDPVKAAVDLMIFEEGEFRAFKHSWYGTLRFLLESDWAKHFVEWLVSFANQNPDNIDDDFSQILLSVDPKALSYELRSAVFELVYNHYKKQILWLPVFTRRFIGKFFQKEHFGVLKSDIKNQKSEVATFVFRGNATAVIDSLFENKSPVLTEREKGFWKNKFVEFANDDNDNGVLQRHALSALTHYKDASLIKKVEKAYSHKDSLVREAFIQFCYEKAPNDLTSIEYFVKAIKGGMVIYGRFGLYEITSKVGILLLLNYFIKDQDFLRIFIDRESIFDEDKDKGDHTLIQNIKNILDSKIRENLEELILTAFKDKDAFHLEKSSFIRKIAVIVSDKNSDFLLKLLQQTRGIKDDQERRFVFYNLEHIFPYLLTKKNLKAFFKELKEFPVDRSFEEATYAVYKAKRELGDRGRKLYHL